MRRESGLYKDEVLDQLAEHENIAQFVSFGPGDAPPQRFAWVRDYEPNHIFSSLRVALQSVLDKSESHSANVRSFNPLKPEANEFVYGLRDVGEVHETVLRLASNGLYTIINETIDIGDGGVSGVLLDDVVEFAPQDTPRAVDKPGVASFPRELGLAVLQSVYGFAPAAPEAGTRIEFSLHPLRSGYRDEHVVVWESQVVGRAMTHPIVAWPNRFSRFIGDKTYGLLIASLAGALVPETSVIARYVRPFSFGEWTGTGEVWTRTSPPEPVPGRFSTMRGYVDPFSLLQREDPSGRAIASVLIQASVAAQYSGAGATVNDDKLLSEGVRGSGEAFMLGEEVPQELPSRIEEDLRSLHSHLHSKLGPIKFEWAHDGERLWLLQLHVGQRMAAGLTIYPGRPEVEHSFNVERGLEALRALVLSIEGSGEGVVLRGAVGITSHFGDVLRRARVPSRIEVPAS